MSCKEILIVAGPNGAGKSTFAASYPGLATGELTYVNADLIAVGLCPGEPARAGIRAGRLMLAELDRLASSGQSFAFETTLSGRGHLRRIRRWRQDGYRVTLLFLSLPSAEHAVARVLQRVALGGHDVPADVIRRRYRASLANFRREYAPVVDEWLLFDNQGNRPQMIERSSTLA